jgi:small subunit ribosomal protein S7
MSDEKTVETQPETPVEQKPEAKETAKPDVPAEQKPEIKEPVQEPAKPEVSEKPKPKTKESAPAEPAKEEAQPVEKPQEQPKGLVPKKIIGIPPDKLKLFDKYDMSEIVVTDAGLAKYINLDPVMVPHTGARHANRPFAKSKMNIVERLVNNMMRNENYTGKKTKTYSAVMDAFQIIESKTKKNPVQIFIDALENTTPREEVTRLKYGGVSVPKAVDVSSSRRLDIALRNICKGAVASSYKNTKPIEVCLANEIMLAAKGDMNSFAISKKEELERVAASAR